MPGAHGPTTPQGRRRNPNIPSPSPQQCPRLFPTAPALPPATLAPSGPAAAPWARPASGVPTHTHTHLAAGSAGPARGQGPIPRRIPQRRRFRAQPRGRGTGGTPGRPVRPGLGRRALRRTAERGAASRPVSPRAARSPRAWAARSRRRRRAEVELRHSESPARGRKPASLGNVAAGANKRLRPAPSSPRRQREHPGVLRVPREQPSGSTVCRRSSEEPTMVAGG